MTKLDFEQKIIHAILLLGVTLSLVQFIYNRSLWFDEAMLALNIINKSGVELLKPLDYNQVAPILFLQLEKLFSILLPNSEYGLRLFPLLCFWFSLYLFYRILRLTFNNPYTIIFSLSLFVFNSTLIYYSSEVKQYMSDVLVLTSIYYFILKSYKKEENKYYLLGIIGSVSILLSNVAPIILFSGGLYLFYDYLINQRIYFKYIAGVYFVWVITFLLYYYYFIHGHTARDIMISYWSNVDAFMPHNPINIDFYKFLRSKLGMIFSSLLPFGVGGRHFLRVLFLIGSVTLFIKRKTGVLILTLIPIILHLLLSALKLYPFDLRLILYTCSIIIIITSFGFDYITNFIFTYLKIERFRLLSILIPVSLLFTFYIIGFPIKREEIKKSINYIQQHINKNDKIYVYYGAAYAFKYYNYIQFINTSASIVKGSKNIKNKEKYINELKNLKGRIWLLFAHAHIWDDDEETYIVRQLDSLGYNKIETFITDGSSTYLYDFGD